MDLKDFILKSLERTQTTLADAVGDLEPDGLRWRAGPEANPIGFILWHLIRVEDRFIHALIQEKPQVWEEEKWCQRMNLPNNPGDSGFGYTVEQVAAFPVPELGVLLQYGEAVRARTIEFIKNLEPAGLSRILEHPRLGRVTVAALIARLLVEVNQHIGQIGYIHGLWKSQK